MNTDIQYSIQLAREAINKAQGNLQNAQAYLAQQAEWPYMGYPLKRIKTILKIIARLQDELGRRLEEAK